MKTDMLIIVSIVLNLAIYAYIQFHAESAQLIDQQAAAISKLAPAQEAGLNFIAILSLGLNALIFSLGSCIYLVLRRKEAWLKNAYAALFFLIITFLSLNMVLS